MFSTAVHCNRLVKISLLDIVYQTKATFKFLNIFYFLETSSSDEIWLFKFILTFSLHVNKVAVFNLI